MRSSTSRPMRAARCCILLFALCLILLAMPAAAGERDADCGAFWVRPAVDVEGIMAPPRIDNSKSSDQIAIIARESGYSRSLRRASLLGLTYAFTGPSIAIETRYRKESDGRLCVRLERVKFTFGARSTDVYVARKYRPGSCAYNVILEHEMEHVRINERLVRDYIPKIEKDLAERAAAIRPFYHTDIKRAGQSIGNRLRFELEALLNEFNAVRLRENDIIDTPQSYAEIHARCRDW